MSLLRQASTCVVQYGAALLRVCMGLLLVRAGLWKLSGGSSFSSLCHDVCGSLGLPNCNELIRVVTYVLPRVEILLGTLIVLGLCRRFALASASLLVVGITGILIAAGSGAGSGGSCGCFGVSLLDSGSLLSIALRNMALVALATALAVQAKQHVSLDALCRRLNPPPGAAEVGPGRGGP